MPSEKIGGTQSERLVKGSDGTEEAGGAQELVLDLEGYRGK